MEDYRTHVNPHVKRVVQSFQTAAVRSLSGPNGLPLRTQGVPGLQPKMSAIEVEEYHKALVATKKLSDEKNVEFDSPFLAPPPFPIQQMPVFTPVDTTKSERSDTVLEGETIACFTVGGEKRLCLPQILNTVLRDFTLQQINAVCDELHIFCSRCNQIQLETLKVLNILPSSAPSCGLITKTDSERLCNALLHGNPERSLEPPSRNSFKVYHECFGKCKGMLSPETYTSPDSKCIRCVDCYGMFSPPKFVCHSHKSLENRTCHWGFDSANWRSYLLLAKDQNLNDNGRLQDAIEEIKSRFDPAHKQKRRQSPDRSLSSSSKRIKTESGSETPSEIMTPSPTSATSWDALSLRQLSAFHLWSPSLVSAIKEGKLLPPPAIMREGLAAILPPYLHTGPPVLLNPERVVPYSESERYERHFTPNVSLAPSSGQKSPTEDEEDENNDDKPREGQTSIDSHHSSDSSLRKSSHGSSKFDGEHRDTMEYDLTTDTDDSSMASPTESCTDIRLSDMPLFESTLEREMDMVRSALEGNVETPEAKSRFLQEFSKMRAKTEEMVQLLLRAHRQLKQELEANRRHTLELEEMMSKTEREVRNLAVEKECALKEARMQKEQLESQMHNKIEATLENRLRSLESLYREVCNENHALRREIAMLVEKSSPTKYTNGVDKVPKSRLRQVLDSSSLQESNVGTGNTKQSNSEVEVKRERDITVD